MRDIFLSVQRDTNLENNKNSKVSIYYFLLVDLRSLHADSDGYPGYRVQNRRHSHGNDL